MIFNDRPRRAGPQAALPHLAVEWLQRRWAALMHQPRRLRFAIEHALNYLANNATRAHPKRDRKTGRLKLGMEHVFEGLKD